MNIKIVRLWLICVTELCTAEFSAENLKTDSDSSAVELTEQLILRTDGSALEKH